MPYWQLRAKAKNLPERKIFLHLRSFFKASAMKIINPKLHGLLDYVFVLLLWSSPVFLNFNDFAGTFTYTLGGAYLLLTLLTDFKMGALKLIPLNLHGLIEFGISILLVILAYTLFKNDETVKLFYVAMGFVVFVIALLSNYEKSTP